LKRQAWQYELPAARLKASIDGSPHPSGASCSRFPQRRHVGGPGSAGLGSLVMGNYPHHRRQPATFWLARPGATIDAASDRVRGIRRIFLEQLGGRATLDDIGQAAADAGLLEGLTTDRSARETVKAALRPVGTTDWWQSAERAAQLSPQSARG
jgi:hypothetical protein